MAKDVLATVYETLLCSPGMNEAVKVDLKINRKTVLMLGSIIERGLNSKEGDGQPGLIEVIPKEIAEELRTLAGDCLQKAGLSELSEKLKSLAGK
jgi:hypothetical protein